MFDDVFKPNRWEFSRFSRPVIGSKFVVEGALLEEARLRLTLSGRKEAATFRLWAVMDD